MDGNMNKLMGSKRNLLWLAGGVTVILVVFDYAGTDTLCGGKQYTGCMQNLHSFLLIFLPIIPLFILTLLVWMRDEIYRTWFKFARWWIPLSMVLIFITPEYGQGLFDPIVKGTVAFLTSALFVVISLGIIIVKYFTARSKAWRAL